MRVNVISKRIRWGLGLLLLVNLLSACERSHLTEVSEQGIILAFGDSLTVGVGASRSDSYPSILQQLSGRTVINAGISGETTAEGMERLPDLLAQTEPNYCCCSKEEMTFYRTRIRRRPNTIWRP